ncbi:hypothetical protein A6A04_10250 [Paramagnetospirillum marisnigri]|uniref:Co-chaperone DjlA N-terminal domain-containing protein n=2 Tax=Paramagnetospirillum marisnigri TaxID=1285242 RepID=A0A178MXF5_9PROT|nr:hypothetical protein A6A04_10250 [Paramagnetospirillum marisnigri]
MFLQHLDAGQRRALVIFAYYVMAADNEVAPEELAIVAALEHELGLEGCIHPGEMLVEPLFSEFPDRRSRMAVMLKLYAVAHADRKIHPKERAMLDDYARRIGLTEAEVAALDQWGQRHTALVEEARRLVEG